MESLAVEIRHRLGPTPRLADTPLISIAVVNRDGAAHLRRLLTGLEDRTDYPRLELILVDNASGDESLETVRAAQTRFPISIVANQRNESFSDACNQGAERARGELLLFLNNDIEPFESGWLRELVACLEEPRVGLAGATLLQPDESTDRSFMVQHRAMRLREENGLLRADLRGRGDDPLSPDLGEDADTPIAAGACMLIRRDLFQQIGGFTHGFDYGGEDIDLGLKVLDCGKRVACSGRSLLIHRLGSTRTMQGRKRQQARRQANRRLLWERWGPRLQREYELDRISGGGLWAAPSENSTRPPTREEALALGFCLKSSESARTDDDPLELLRDALTSRGHRCLLLRDGEINDVQGFGYDVAVYLLSPTRYALGPSQLNVLWSPGAPDPTPRVERDGYDLTSADPTPPQLIETILERAEQLAFPTRIGTNAGPRLPDVRSAG